jgi:molybdenum cofactor biosynthesis enzyme MoaA
MLVLSQKPLIQKVRIAVVWGCDYKCHYCRPGGDGAKSNNSRNLSIAAILRIAKLFELAGCSQLNITGGEPTLRKDIGKLLDVLLISTNLNIHLNTNGFRLPGVSQVLAAQKRLSIIASLDSASNLISTSLGRPGAPDRIDRLLQYGKQIGVGARVNCVLTKSTNSPSQLLSVIEFTRSRGVPIKFQTVFDTKDEAFCSAADLYVDASVLRKTLRELGLMPAGVSNTSSGVSEEIWRDGTGFTVTVLDKSPQNTVFTRSCLVCEKYPCDTGMYAYYVDHAGTLNRCRTDRRPICDLSKLKLDGLSVNALRAIMVNVYGKHAMHDSY